MPKGLDSGDRKLLIGAGVVLVLVLIASAVFSPKRTGGGWAYPSSYSSDWDGAKAAYLVLQESGYSIKRWEKPPEELGATAEDDDDGQQVLVLADPIETASNDDRAAIRKFLERGGRVLATGPRAERMLPDPESFEQDPFEENLAKFSPVVPSSLMANAPEIAMKAPDHWEPHAASHLVIYRNRDTAAVVSYQIGKGQVIWWGDSSPLTNRGIKEASNLNLLLNSAGAAKGTHILWDEYFHGVHGSLWAYFARTPLPWGVLQFGIAFLAILATFSRRLGPARIPAKTSRLSPLEFVDTLGDLYAARHAGSAAIRIVHQRLRFQLTRQLGVATDATSTELARAASDALGWEETQLLATLQRAEHTAAREDVRDAESLPLVQEMVDYLARLQVKGAPKEERHTG